MRLTEEIDKAERAVSRVVLPSNKSARIGEGEEECVVTDRRPSVAPAYPFIHSQASDAYHALRRHIARVDKTLPRPIIVQDDHTPGEGMCLPHPLCHLPQHGRSCHETVLSVQHDVRGADCF